MALKQVNQTDIKTHMKNLIIRTILIAAMICIFGFSLFSHFKRRLSVDLKQLESYSNTSEKNEIQSIISTLKATQQQLKNSNKTATECQIIVNEKSKQVQQVTEQLLHSQEAERQNISQFIHNDLGQHLTALNLETAVLESKVTSPNDLNPNQITDSVIPQKNQSRLKVHPPTPIQSPILIECLPNHAKDILPDEITITMASTNFIETNLTQAQKLSLFRTFQEAITNIVRHANASHIQVDLATTTTHHTLRITDDGIGISNAAPSTGLTAIKHRIAMNNGTFDLKKQPANWHENERDLTPGALMKKNICIIDDHEIIRTGIRRVLNQSDGYDVVYEFPSNASLLNQPITKPLDIIIQDLDLEDGCNLSQLEILSYKCPNVPVLIYTMHPESMYGLACLKYNIAGYLTKDKPIRDLLTAIDTICSGNNYFTPELNQLLANHYINKDTASVDHLSQREQEVFVLIGEGFSPTEIAKNYSLISKPYPPIGAEF